MKVATKKARALREALGADEVIARLALSPEELDILDALAAGHDVKGGALALAAIRTKLDFSITRPAARVNVAVAHISVLDPYAAPALPAVVDAALLPGEEG